MNAQDLQSVFNIITSARTSIPGNEVLATADLVRRIAVEAEDMIRATLKPADNEEQEPSDSAKD